MHSFRDSIAAKGHYIYKLGMVPGKSGNISYRSGNVMGITPSGMSLKDVQGEDIVLLDLKTSKVIIGEQPSSELALHSSIYLNREDINAVVHTHSPYASGFALAGADIKWLEGFGPIKSEFIPKVKYATPGSEELAEIVIKCLIKEDMALLEGHGVVCLGKNLDEAVLMAEWIENVAKTIFISENILKNKRLE